MIAIYKVTNKLNRKLYVGQTKQLIEKRFLQHSKADSPLGNAMQDCGLENFTIEIIEECETKVQADERERFWIKVLKCKYPNGYNQTDGGAGLTGFVPVRRQQQVVPRPLPPPRLSSPPSSSRSSEMTIGESLKRLRTSLGLSQKQVANAGKVSWQSYQSYESGKASPSVKIIMNIADAYDVSTDYLVGRSDMPNPTNFDEKEVREAFAFRDAWQKAMQSLPQVPAQ